MENIHNPSLQKKNKGKTRNLFITYPQKGGNLDSFVTYPKKRGRNLEIGEVPCKEGVGQLLAPTPPIPQQILCL